MQTSENCHPKKFLAVEIVVGEDKCRLLWSFLERAISYQFHVGYFTCKQCSRSIWDIHGRRIFSLVGIPCFRKWPNLVLFLLALRLWIIITVWLVHIRACESCGKFCSLVRDLSTCLFKLTTAAKLKNFIKEWFYLYDHGTRQAGNESIRLPRGEFAWLSVASVLPKFFCKHE